jgi:hypothetical protein
VLCGDLAPADCAPAANAVLQAIPSTVDDIPHFPSRVELGSGVFCPTPGLLFENTTCPAGGLPPADSGQCIGHAVVTFAGFAAQDYLNIEENGSTFQAALIAAATPPPATPSLD